MKISDLNIAPNTEPVATLEVGGLYRRLVKSPHGGTDTVVGLVTGIINDGERIAIAAVETLSQPFLPHAVLRSFSGEDEVEILPVREEEYNAVIRRTLAKAEMAVTEAESKLDEAINNLALVRALIRVSE